MLPLPLMFMLVQAASTAQPSTSTSEIQWFASLGVGGILAGIMFFYSRLDRKASEKRYEELARDLRSLVQDNTKALTMLVSIIERPGLVECPYALELRRQQQQRQQQQQHIEIPT